MSGRPIGILADLQGPKLRVGVFAKGRAELVVGATFRLDLDRADGDVNRVQLPHKEIFDALEPGARLLVNDGKIRLKVKDCGADFANCTVIVGGTISNRKGVNVPDVVLPLAALSDKDRKDLEFVCELGVDWLALSFVQRPADVVEARELCKGRAAILSKIEKPAAVKAFDEILAVSRRHHGGARRSGRRTARAERAADPETSGAQMPCCGQAGDRGDADAGIDDRIADADPRRSVRRGDRHL